MVEFVGDRNECVMVEIPKTMKGLALFTLEQMQAAGSWHGPTLTRAIEIIQGFKEPGIGPYIGGEARIEDGAVLIRVPLSALPAVVEGAWATNNLNPRYRITDTEAFAADLLRALNREKEDGTTPVHEMFDRCINYAIEHGAEGIVEHEQQEV